MLQHIVLRVAAPSHSLVPQLLPDMLHDSQRKCLRRWGSKWARPTSMACAAAPLVSLSACFVNCSIRCAHMSHSAGGSGVDCAECVGLPWLCFYPNIVKHRFGKSRKRARCHNLRQSPSDLLLGSWDCTRQPRSVCDHPLRQPLPPAASAPLRSSP